MKISGHTFLITGGASGLGEQCVRHFHAQGANVIFCDMNDEGGKKLQEELGEKTAYFSCNVVEESMYLNSNVCGVAALVLIFLIIFFFMCAGVFFLTEDVMAALAGGLKKFGQLHGVINTAGVGNPRRVISSTGTVHSLKDFRWVVEINLIGTFNVLRLSAAVMAKQAPEQNERGVIINVASVAAFDGQIGQAAYSASKAAVVGMALPIAREFAELGIRVVTVAPGLFGMISQTRVS
jgi:NAD(P)-dependent dehydrogenase (short-subunit alcohol dehydrogenase family)